LQVLRINGPLPIPVVRQWLPFKNSPARATKARCGRRGHQPSNCALGDREFADWNGDRSWPSIPTLAQEARCSQRRVYKAVAKAVRLGELERLSRGGLQATNRYRLTLVHPQLPLPSVHPEPVASCTSGILNERAKNPAAGSGEPSRTTRVVSASQKRAPAAPGVCEQALAIWSVERGSLPEESKP